MNGSEAFLQAPWLPSRSIWFMRAPRVRVRSAHSHVILARPRPGHAIRSLVAEARRSLRPVRRTQEASSLRFANHVGVALRKPPALILVLQLGRSTPAAEKPDLTGSTKPLPQGPPCSRQHQGRFGAQRLNSGLGQKSIHCPSKSRPLKPATSALRGCRCDSRDQGFP